MATNLVYSWTESRVWTVGSNVAPGTAVVSVSNEPGVTITGSGDYTRTETSGPFTISGIPAGGVGLLPTEATVATNGTWEFPVTGGSSTTPNNTAVYRTGGGLITLTASGNTAFGVVDIPPGYVFDGTTLPIKIGVFV